VSSSPKSKESVRANLKPELQAVFDELFNDYEQAVRLHTKWRKEISSNIPAELVRRGWRKLE
jgi:hypothetical protein